VSAPLFLLHVRFVTNAGEVLLSHLTCCRVDKNTHLEKEEGEGGGGKRGGERKEEGCEVVGGGEGEWV